MHILCKGLYLMRFFLLFFFLISISITPTPFNKLHTQLVSAIRNRLRSTERKTGKTIVCKLDFTAARAIAATFAKMECAIE